MYMNRTAKLSLLPFFVATKKIKLLSGNTDGFALFLNLKLQLGKGNRLTLRCLKLHRNSTCR